MDKKPVRPATTLEGREEQLISRAVDLAEKQLLEGTASAQVISHFLKLGSTRERLEQARLERENKLLEAKVEQIAAQRGMEELFQKAISAMRTYSGQAPLETDDDFED